MDFDLESGSENSEDEKTMKTMESNTHPVRSQSRKRFLLKMFNIRTMLKWKYNYFEAVPHEHRVYTQFLKKSRYYRRSREFKKMWRLKMDQLFDEETLKANKILLERELKNLNESQDSGISTPDLSRLLVNYDREVVNMIRRVQDEFCFFMKFPKCYPNYIEEKKNFLLQQCATVIDEFADIDVDIDEQFKSFWMRRISVLCDSKIKQEKGLIRKNWKQLLPAYVGNVSQPEELQELLLSDNDDDDEMN